MTSAAPTTATRRGGLVLVGVEPNPVLAALAPAPAGDRPAPRRRAAVRLLRDGGAAPALVGVVADRNLRGLSRAGDRRCGPADRRLRHVGDVQEAVHAGLQLDERPEVGQVADL